MIRNKKFKLLILFAIFFVAFFCIDVFAAKYTITNGLDFNTRIKIAINEEYTSATEEKTIKAFKSSYSLPNDNTKIIDISEDGDSSVLAYIKDNVLYYVSEDEVFLNADSSYMFDKFINMKEIDLSEMNFSKVRKMNYMFSNCRFLTNIDMDNDTLIKLNEIKGMFFDCESLVDIYINMLYTKNVTNMDELFNNCKNVKNIYISRDYWSVSKVTSFKNMFKNCYLLRTNFLRKAMDIDEANYKMYATYGEDEGREGLLKDIDYEYDYYGDDNETYKVTDINEKAAIAVGSVNLPTNILASDIIKAKDLSNVNVASDSIFYEQMAEASIKDGKMKFSEKLLSETLNDIPILIDETTFVDVIKFKNKATISDYVDIAPIEEENDIPGGVLRHDYSDIYNISETLNNNVKQLSDNETIKDKKISEIKIDESPFVFDINLLIVIISILLIVLLSIVYTLRKQKRDNKDLKDGL